VHGRREAEDCGAIVVVVVVTVVVLGQVAEIRKLVEQGARFPIDVTEEVSSHTSTHTHTPPYLWRHGLIICCLTG
jgi:hypothetical protein